jgi:hypothetical protein
MMDIFHGISLQPGITIAGAAKLTPYGGIATFATDRLQQLAENMRRFGGELPEIEQVIVVAETIPPSFWKDLTPGIEITGIALCAERPFATPFNCPAVFDLSEKLFDDVNEGDILILDGNRGRVYLNPDAMTIARYQVPKLRAKRYFLEGVHIPARTASENREITVLASIPSRAEISIAIQQGADGIFIPQDNDFLGSFLHSAHDQIHLLREISEETGGLPLYVQIDPDQLALTALLRAAAETPLHFVINTLVSAQDFLNEIEMLGMILDEQETPFGRVHLEALISTSNEDTIPDSLECYDGVVIDEHFDDAEMERLLVTGAQAMHYRKPLTVRLTGDRWQECLYDALAIGSTRLIVSPEYIPHIKDAIREF